MDLNPASLLLVSQRHRVAVALPGASPEYPILCLQRFLPTLDLLPREPFIWRALSPLRVQDGLLSGDVGRCHQTISDPRMAASVSGVTPLVSSALWTCDLFLHSLNGSRTMILGGEGRRSSALQRTPLVQDTTSNRELDVEARRADASAVAPGTKSYLRRRPRHVRGEVRDK